MYAIKVKGFTDDNYLIGADHDEIDTFPTIKDAEEELAYIQASGLAPIGDCEIVPYNKKEKAA